MPAPMTADDFAALLRDKHAQFEQAAVKAAKLELHRPSIRTMRRNLLRLRWWQWRRRRNIEFQLAQIALALGE